MSASPARLRRSATAVLVLAAAATALTACADSTTAAAPEASAHAANTVSTLYGDVSVPAGAKRIVALDFPEATALADLGITPVGIGSYTPDFPAYTTAFKDVPNVTDSAGAPDYEKIAALKPDLIVTDEFATDVEKNRPVYERLKSIAPTVVLEWTQAAGNWPADAAGTAAAVGKTKQLDALKADYEAKAAGIKSKYADVLAAHTVDLVSSGSGTKDWFLYSANSSHGKVLADAGAKFGAAAAQKDGFAEYSPEKYDLLKDTDVVIVEGAAVSDATGVTSNPVFAALPAAKAGDVFATQYFFPSSYQIAGALLDDFATALGHVK